MKNLAVFFLAIFALVFTGCSGSFGTISTGGSLEVESSVEDGSEDVPLDTIFTVTFPKAVDTDTVTSDTFYLALASESASIGPPPIDGREPISLSESVSGSIECENTLECALTPTTNLQSETEYELHITSGIQFGDGNNYSGSIISFTTTSAMEQVTTPEFSQNAGTHNEDIDVEITTTTSGASVYYTIDGSNPDEESNLYSEAISIAGDGTEITIKAQAYLDNMTPSGVISATFVINYDQVAEPQLSLAGDTYNDDIEIEISSNTSGASIYYTTDGSDPTDESDLYSGAIDISGEGTAITLKTIAYKDGMSVSEIITAQYIIDYMRRVSVGVNHSCEVRDNGTLWCWGDNTMSQLGDGTTDDSYSPIQVGSDTNWSRVSCGNAYSCALKTNGTLYCWGDNGSGQFGNGTTDPQTEPTQIGSAIDWYRIVTGAMHTCGLKTDGTLYCWGDNNEGQLGNNSNDMSSSPVQESSLSTDWETVAAGSGHTCGIKTGELYCWGFNMQGQLGDGTIDSKNNPTRVGSSSDWNTISLGNEHSCGINESGALYCWGSDSYDQFGDAASGQQSSPVLILSSVESLALGGYHTCFIKTNGTLFCLGDNTNGELGDGTQDSPTSPSQESTSSTEWAAISANDGNTCGVREDDSLWCWGSRSMGDVGDGTGPYVSSLTQEGAAKTNWNQLGMGEYHTCAIDADSKLFCWGQGSYSQMGNDSSNDIFTPTQLGSGADWQKISSTGGYHSCAIKTNGTLWCWGYNQYGMIGDGSTDTASTPVQESTLSSSWSTVIAGRYHTCGLKTDGTIWCWGANSMGELGDNSGSQQNSPAQEASEDTTWDKIAKGMYHTCGIKANGTLWCWGLNGNGQIGDNSTDNRPTPTQENSASTTWSSIDGGWGHTCAIKTDGTLWCWGWNVFGQVGDGTTERRLVPTQVGSDTDWLQITAETSRSCAVKTGGTLWCWGQTTAGSLVEPTQVDENTDWVSVDSGAEHLCAMKSDNSIWCYGNNTDGQVGTGWTPHLTTPTEITE